MAIVACSTLLAEVSLTNSILKVDASDPHKVAGWQLSPSSTWLSVETSDVPDGVSSALRIKVSDPSPSSGSLTQRMVLPYDTAKLRLTGWMRSDLPRAGYIEVKLYSDKQELVRMNGGVLSSDLWQQVTIDIDPEVVTKKGDRVRANKMEVLCRWYRQDKHIGGSVLFADLKLIQTDATVAVLGGSTATEDGKARKFGWGSELGSFFNPEVAVLNVPLPSASSDAAAHREALAACLATKPSVVLLQNDWCGLLQVEPAKRSELVTRQVEEDIKAARAAGVPIVLVTPPARRMFDGTGSYIDEFSAEGAALQAVAKANAVAVVDLYGQSVGLISRLGGDGSKPLYRSIKDRGNLSRSGAHMMAAMVADSLIKQIPKASASIVDVAAVRKVL